jgi:hypothetical protein
MMKRSCKSGFISHEHLLRLKEAVYIKNVITDGQVGLGQGSVGRVRLDEIGSGQESGVRGGERSAVLGGWVWGREDRVKPS